ncbi:hypothetical protein EDB87DRAFT_96415 [Lactarius vividus]|nr:hypothetical protein EDB87DRAFT_96415 [Lactarius vividus]
MFEEAKLVLHLLLLGLVAKGPRLRPIIDQHTHSGSPLTRNWGSSLQLLLAYTTHNVQHVVTYTDRKLKRGSNVQPEVINSEDNEHPELKERNKKKGSHHHTWKKYASKKKSEAGEGKRRETSSVPITSYERVCAKMGCGDEPSKIY